MSLSKYNRDMEWERSYIVWCSTVITRAIFLDDECGFKVRPQAMNKYRAESVKSKARTVHKGHKFHMVKLWWKW